MVRDGCKGADVLIGHKRCGVGAKVPGCTRIELVKVKKVVRQVGKRIVGYLHSFYSLKAFCCSSTASPCEFPRPTKAFPATVHFLSLKSSPTSAVGS